MSKLIDITGKTFGRLTVIERAANKGKQTSWKCECECGALVAVRGPHLKSGATASCGCLNAELARQLMTKHGMARTKIYRTWTRMKSRCLNRGDRKYADYGARGIKVCKRWMRFENFAEDMGEPGKEMTIERINNNGDYEPSNCRWATLEEQAQNKRTTLRITVSGKTMRAEQWARATGIPAKEIRRRLHRGWSAERAVRQPMRVRQREKSFVHSVK